MQNIMKYLSKAKKDNQIVDFQHVKLLLTGSSAVGKSSFCRLLFGLKFLSEYNSTDVMESKQALSVFIPDKSEPVTVKNFGMLKQDGEVVWLELDLKCQIKYFKSLLLSHKFHAKNTLQVQKLAKSSHHDNDNYLNLPEVPQTNIEKQIIVTKSLPESFIIETVKLITVVDTGGQPEYIHLLPAINSYPTVNFLVHDLTKKLEDPVQVLYKKKGREEAPVQILNYSNLDMIHLLMCFVTDSLQQPPEQTVQCISAPTKSYIGFVGTHYDKVKDNPAIIQCINDKLTSIVKERNCQFAILPAKGGIIHPVDNTTAGSDSKNEDPEIKLIRSQIEDLANQIETNILPITWMILQLEIQEIAYHSSQKIHHLQRIFEHC